MRKSTVKWIVAGGALLLLGAVLFVLGMGVLDWNFASLDTAVYEQKQFAPAADENRVARVECKVSSFGIEVVRGEAIAFDYYETDNSHTSVTAEDGVLRIVETYDYNFFKDSWFSFGKWTRKFKLTVPDGVEIALGGTNISVRLEGITTASVTADGTNSDITMIDCAVDALTVKATNADVVLRRLSAGNVTLSGTNLDLTVDNCAFGTLEAKGTNTDADVNDTVCSLLSLHGTNGDFDLVRVTTDDLTLSATNLDADILLVGVESEYSVQTHGRRLPPARVGTTDKKVELRGTNNSVKLRWEK